MICSTSASLSCASSAAHSCSSSHAGEDKRMILRTDLNIGTQKRGRLIVVKLKVIV